MISSTAVMSERPLHTRHSNHWAFTLKEPWDGLLDRGETARSSLSFCHTKKKMEKEKEKVEEGLGAAAPG